MPTGRFAELEDGEVGPGMSKFEDKVREEQEKMCQGTMGIWHRKPSRDGYH